jgi:hypothetical protein
MENHMQLGVVMYTCNPSNLGGKDRRMIVQSKPREKI